MKTLFHIVNDVCVKVQNISNADVHIVESYELEDTTYLKYDPVSGKMKVTELDLALVGQTKELAEKDGVYLLVGSVDHRAGLVLEGATFTEFVFRELDRIEMSFGKKVSDIVGGLPVYSSNESSDRIIAMEQARYDALIAAL